MKKFEVKLKKMKLNEKMKLNLKIMKLNQKMGKFNFNTVHRCCLRPQCEPTTSHSALEYGGGKLDCNRVSS